MVDLRRPDPGVRRAPRGRGRWPGCRRSRWTAARRRGARCPSLPDREGCWPGGRARPYGHAPEPAASPAPDGGGRGGPARAAGRAARRPGRRGRGARRASSPSSRTPPGSRPTPAEGWTVAHQIAHLAWTDEQALLAATDPAASPRRRRPRPRTWPAPSTPPRPGRRGPARALLDRWRARPGARWPTRWRRLPEGTPAALVRPADERRLDGHRPADGDLGARPRRHRRARAAAVGRRRGCGTSRTSASAPATSPSPSTGCPPRPSRSASSSPRPDGVAWTWGPRTPRSGSPARRSTSACGSPSAGTAPTWR